MAGHKKHHGGRRGNNRFMPFGETASSGDASLPAAPSRSIPNNTQRELDVINQHVNHQPQGVDSSDWMQMPEIPTGAELNVDIHDPAEADKLRANIPENPVNQPYESKDVYLETHYRLHREETVGWLRLAVLHYKEEPAMMDTNETCVYTKVFVQGYLMTRLGPVCRVQFSAERAGKEVDWKVTTRLRTGSLVALSTVRDGFRTICMPAVIADHYFEDGLNQNPPTIQFFWGDINDAILDPLEELVMVESRYGFFEATRHAMTGLQHMARTPTTIDKYLVRGCQEDVAAEYVQAGPHKDISSLIHHLPDDKLTDSEFEKQIQKVRENHSSKNILNSIEPNISRFTNLDNSQLEAVHRMLTKECAIIQGPPGTGKTFTSVQAIQILLNNQVRGKQIVVVSAQTNHAVDQILVLLLDLGYEIARLGGRTQHEGIKRRSMYSIRQEKRSDDRIGSKEYGRCEKDRQRLNNQIRDFVAQTFASVPLSPDQLYQADLITAEQCDHFNNEEWQFEVEEGAESVGRVGEWLKTDLLRIRPFGYKDTLFTTTEYEREAEAEVEKPVVDLDACIAADDADDDRLLGDWIPLSPNWTAAIPNDVAPTEQEIITASKNPDPYRIDQTLRGSIYRYWQAVLIEKQTARFRMLLRQSVVLSKRQKVQRWLTDVRCLHAAQVDIIGCTTTGLTKYRGLFSALQPRTILIEEAAETREANITAGLPEGLQQLILVGDHQQLAPSTDVKALAGAPFNLKVSMFERLIGLELPFTMLNMQRRMISPLRELLNNYYPKLIDHPIIATRPRTITGLHLNSFFFNHTWSETTDENFSKYNETEADMVIGFAKYLLMNGTKPDKITILTFYRGQCKRLLAEARRQLLRWKFPDHSIRTVDSYQGEENDIVILSLVRSNGTSGSYNTGFAGNKNRGVVAISRARQGFFVFGNSVNFVLGGAASREMWYPVAKTFQKQGKMLDNGCLPLVCQNHGNRSEIKTPLDWSTHDGGCQEECHGQRECGHPCKRKCHPMPCSYLKCAEECELALHCGHNCKRLCGEECMCEEDCNVFTGAFMRDTDFEKPSRTPQTHYDRKGKKSLALPQTEPATAWKIDNFVNSLNSAEAPTAPSLDISMIQENYLQVDIDRTGNRFRSQPAVSRELLLVPATGLLVDEDFPSLTSCTDALSIRLVPEIKAGASEKQTASLTKTKRVSAPVEEGDLIDFS
ncbi:helicase required for RNAi-mediated heterochromatin assembly 1 [Microdochium nivale]|nr:helicase required for RNAi-mediated heterochromatin assembly 1 [Microdochium nivale]